MFSFKINKKASSTSAPVVNDKQSASKKAFQDDDDNGDEEPDFIDGLDGTSIVSKKPSKKKEKQVLVIPLISKNEWRIDKKPDENEENADDANNAAEGEPGKDEPPKAPESLEDLAVKELMEEASSKKSDNKKNSKTIPILFQNKVPDGYEEDDNMDVSLRPDQSSLEDYERIPIEEYGLALLRGMGWKETEGIGLKNKKVVDMAEPKLRPKGMGLGAEAAHKNKDVTPKTASKGNEEQEDLSIRIGAYAVITKGSKKGHYGQIESFDEDNNRVILKLGISGKMEAVSKFYINVVPAKEYKKNSKVINSEKYEEYKAKQDKRDKDRQNGEQNSKYYEEDPRKRRTHRSSSSSDDNYDRSRSKSRRNPDSDDYSEKRSSHKERIGDDITRYSSRDKRDTDRSSRHDNRRYDEDRDRDRNRNGDHSKHSSKYSDKKSHRDRDSHRSRKDDDRDRRRRD